MKTIHTSIATHKWLLKRQGIFKGSHVRAPGAELNEAQGSELEQILENLR
jgi:dihydrodipicolinate synthase/N-acetylneuraminate lyase